MNKMKAPKYILTIVLCVSIVAIVFFVSFLVNSFNEKSEIIKKSNILLSDEERAKYRAPNESSNFNIDYSYILFDSTSSEYDSILYEFTVQNITEKKLINVNVDVRTNNNLSNIMPNQYAYTKETDLKPFSGGVATRVSLSWLTLAIAYDDLSNVNKLLFDNSVDELYLEITWKGGSERVILDNNYAKNVYDLRGKGYTQENLQEMLSYVKNLEDR